MGGPPEGDRRRQASREEPRGLEGRGSWPFPPAPTGASPSTQTKISFLLSPCADSRFSQTLLWSSHFISAPGFQTTCSREPSFLGCFRLITVRTLGSCLIRPYGLQFKNKRLITLHVRERSVLHCLHQLYLDGKRRRGRQRVRWLDGITNSMDMSLSTLR